jgi:hypothetical protein
MAKVIGAIHKRRAGAKRAEPPAVDLLGDIPNCEPSLDFDYLSVCDVLPVHLVRFLVGEMVAIRGTFDESGADRPTEEEIERALIVVACGDRASADEAAVLRASVPGLRSLIFDLRLPRSGGQDWNPALVVAPVAFDQKSSYLVAKLCAMRGTVDGSGANRPTEEDIGEALICAAGERECADETSILDSAVPALKKLIDAPDGPAMLAAMEVACGALCGLMAPPKPT